MIQPKMDARIEKLCLLVLFLFAISFLNLAGYIVCVVFLIFLFAIIRYPLLLDGNFFVLLYFSLFYFCNHMIHEGLGFKELIWYLLAPWWIYLCGKWYVAYSTLENPLRRLVMILAGGFFLHGMLNVFAYINTYGISYVLSTPYRITMDFWRGEVISVTASSLYYVPLMTLSVGYLFCGSRKKTKVLAFCVIVLGVMVNVLYANRTAFVILASLIAVGVTARLTKRDSAKAWMGTLLAIAAIIVIWSFDIGGVRTWLVNLRVVERFQDSDMSRFDLWGDFLSSEWWRHPLGGEKIGSRSVHNLWLDTMRSVGILPFLLLVLFTVNSIVDVHRFCTRNGKKAGVYAYMIAGIMLSCGVEPVMSANPYYVMLWIMVIGGINGTRMLPPMNDEDAEEETV